MKNVFQTEEVAKVICAIIRDKSIEYLKREPVEVYDALLNSKVKPYSARLVLMSLMCGAVNQVEKKGFDEKVLARFFEKECGLRKEVAADLAQLYSLLFGDGRLQRLKDKELKGLDAFCRKSWTLDVDVDATWECDSGNVDCNYKATVVISGSDKTLVKETVAKELKANPFLKAEEIKTLLEDKLNEVVGDDFEDYVTAEEYYEPIPEDYDENFEDIIEEFCRKNGLCLKSFEGEGHSDGFDSDYI